MTNLRQLIEQANSKKEDGTQADLGAIPTGHKRDKETSDMHSLCVHDIDEEHNFDDGW